MCLAVDNYHPHVIYIRRDNFGYVGIGAAYDCLPNEIRWCNETEALSSSLPKIHLYVCNCDSIWKVIVKGIEYYAYMRKLNIIGLYNVLSPGLCQVIIWASVRIFLIWPLRRNSCKMLIEIHIFSFQKFDFKMFFAKCHFCFVLSSMC